MDQSNEASMGFKNVNDQQESGGIQTLINRTKESSKTLFFALQTAFRKKIETFNTKVETPKLKQSENLLKLLPYLDESPET